jgi:hypothetical protein
MKAEESGKNYCGSYVGNMQGFLASRSCDSCLETTTRRGDRRSLKSDVVIKREQLLICAADLILKRYPSRCIVVHVLTSPRQLAKHMLLNLYLLK